MTRSLTIYALLLLAARCLFVPTFSFADDLPVGVVNTQDPKDVPLTPSQSLQRITVPDGFHVALFAGEPDVRRPIAFDFDDRGRLWVVENYSHPEATEGHNPDRIVIFEDTDNDGQFDVRKVFWDGGRYLSAIAYGHGGVWIGNTPELAFIPDRDGDDVPDSEPIVILDGFCVSSNNVLNNFHWGPDGWLYGAIGLAAKSYIGKPGTSADQRIEMTRGIWRVHPVKHEFEVVALGMVNPWGADFNQYGDLITSNTVISHLWHIVPGMYCQRRGKEQDYPYVYGRIQSIADHLHWGGGQWQDSRKTTQQHSVAGGGHAHCGGMVYLGDNWPDVYRGTFFTANLHGNRINNDCLVRRKSSYVATHGDDFLFGNDPWFRALSVKYGPDGGVFISDWHDLGECHDNDGSHRTSGRIYKITYGSLRKHESFDLRALSSAELASRQMHRNAWHARHARRILHERAIAGDGTVVDKRQNFAIQQELTNAFLCDEAEYRLRALWVMYLVGHADEAFLLKCCEFPEENVRRWAVRLLVDGGEPSRKALDFMSRMAREEPSAKVRLALAVALQRISAASRWAIARGLLSHANDASDPYLPYMIWYGVEPLVEANTAAALRLAESAQIPLVRNFIVRRTLDVPSPPVEEVVTATLRLDDQARLDFLNGMRAAIEGRGRIEPPASWISLYKAISVAPDAATRSAAAQLARTFGDRRAVDELTSTVSNHAAGLAERRDALRALLNLDAALPVSALHDLLREASPLRLDALHALVLRHDDTTPQRLLDSLSQLTPGERQAAVSVLASRRKFALMLFDAIRQGKISRNDVSAYALQQLRSFRDRQVQAAIASLWNDEADKLSAADEIGYYRKLLTAKYLAAGDASAGRKIFAENCAKCHTLFGEGGDVGPDLTGSGRANLDYVLSNLIDPSAIIDAAYRLTTVETSDGRLLSGFIQQQTEFHLVLRTQDAEVKLPLTEIVELETTNRSMMPHGLLAGFSKQQVRDLILYLASPEQVVLPLDE